MKMRTLNEKTIKDDPAINLNRSGTRREENKQITANRSLEELSGKIGLQDAQCVEETQKYTAEADAVDRYRRLNEDRRRSTIVDNLFNQVLGSVNVNIGQLATGAILILVAERMHRGDFTVGDFVLFTTYVPEVARSGSLIGRVMAQHRRAEVSLDRMSETIESPTPAPLVEPTSVYLHQSPPAIPSPPTASDHPLQRLEAEGSALEIPTTITVADPGWWICPGQKILRWTLAVLGVLLLSWIVRGFLSPHRFREGAVLLYAESHDALLEIRDGDDGHRPFRRFPETKRGFRRNAALHLGGPRAPLPSLKRMPDDARLVATGGGGAVLVVEREDAVERFTEADGWQPIPTGEHPVASRLTLRRAGEVYLEVRP